MSLAENESVVMLAIAALEDAGYEVSSDSVYDVITQNGIDLGPLPPAISIPDDPSLNATRVHVLRSLDALERRDPAFITAQSIRAWQAAFPVRVLDVHLTSKGRAVAEALREPGPTSTRVEIGFRPPPRETQ